MHREERERNTKEAQDRPAVDVGSDDLSLTSNWMHRTDWANTFRRANRPLLRRLALAPSADGAAFAIGGVDGQLLNSPPSDERRLLLFGHALNAFFDRCEDTAQRISASDCAWCKVDVPGGKPG